MSKIAPTIVTSLWEVHKLRTLRLRTRTATGTALAPLISACLVLTTAVSNPAAADDSTASHGGRFTSQPKPLERHLRFNQRPLSATELRLVEQLEATYRLRLQDGDYWYDAASGAAGIWGGPTSGFLPPGLSLGGKLPANASGGNTGVFVNGRELHPLDVAALSQLGPVLPGRWFVDGYGNVGYEGGPVLFNLIAAARAAQSRGSKSGGAWGRTTTDGTGRNVYVGGDSSFGFFMDSKSSYSYEK